MRINVYGLGYVGSVTSLCLAKLGHQVTGLEIVPQKIEQLRRGQLSIFEPGLNELFEEIRLAAAPAAVAVGGSRSSARRAGPVAGSGLGTFQVAPEDSPDLQAEVSMVCVGTPSLVSGQVDLSQIQETARLLGRALKVSRPKSIVVFRSTIPPGTTEKLLIPLLENESGMRAGQDFFVCFYPEFLREGHAVEDFTNPSLALFGSDEGSRDFLSAKLTEVFQPREPLMALPMKSAEMIKYACNLFHAIKVTFANEIGALCAALGVNGQEVMETFAKDNVLNLSPYYLRPGYSFGGSCLPKDLRAISSLAAQSGIRLSMLDSVMRSNQEHSLRLLSMLEASGEVPCGFLGVTFKPDTDDIRESPILEVILAMLRKRSYQQARQIIILDRPEVLERIRPLVGPDVILTTEISELLTKSQCLVLGPYRLEKSANRQLTGFKGRIIDLKYHRYSELAKNNLNWQSIC